MKTALVIMAAGIGSRFGGVKQLEPVGIHQETIMDYSVHDAIAAGFDKIIFVIRREMQETFQRLWGSGSICCAAGWGWKWGMPTSLWRICLRRWTSLSGRNPGGTGQAVLACKGLVQEPFGVINATISMAGKHLSNCIIFCPKPLRKTPYVWWDMLWKIPFRSTEAFQEASVEWTKKDI